MLSFLCILCDSLIYNSRSESGVFIYLLSILTFIILLLDKSLKIILNGNKAFSKMMKEKSLKKIHSKHKLKNILIDEPKELNEPIFEKKFEKVEQGIEIDLRNRQFK